MIVKKIEKQDIDVDYGTTIYVENKVIKLDANHAGAKLDLAILHCKLGNKFQTELLLNDLESKYYPNQNIKNVLKKLRSYSCGNQNSNENSNKNN